MSTPIIPDNWNDPADKYVLSSVFEVYEGRRFSGHYGPVQLLDDSSPEWDRMEAILKIKAEIKGYEIDDLDLKRSMVVFDKEKGEVV